MADGRYDVVVIGAGILGLAAAREILARRPGTRIAVLEKESSIAGHQTGRNSGVIHTGIYYAPGSLKARLCVAGARELYDYCERHGIPTERCGKLIVAVDEAELPGLEALYRRGLENGVAGLELVGPDRIRELEPHAVGLRAIWSPGTGIVDFSRVAEAMATEIAAGGADVRTGHEVTRIEERGGEVRVATNRGVVLAGRALACAGLFADRIAARSGGSREPRIVPFRGAYWQLRPDRRHLVRNLIYPVPDPRYPFLGVHFTRRIRDGAVWLGPNAVLAFAREGYRRRDVNLRDLAEVVTNPGFLRLAGGYLRTGLAEMYRDTSKRAFVASCRRFVPELSAADAVPGPTGIRAQCLGRDGRLVDDFVFDAPSSRVMHVRNAPSPAATASLAIASAIVDRFEEA
ncbi:MAG TPA: L-2-hydroxyglutarate oxidase [Candidatus Limnocylindrales bacterium]|nr:L-2-hydroxyglutarate oxidase [Candidatus Limnocylindrales bacterium]